ncbi:reverse transcriptase domain-containing protein [Tanacetum coccineum]
MRLAAAVSSFDNISKANSFVLRARFNQELQKISAFVDSRLESIELFLNRFADQPNETTINNPEPDDGSVETPLVSPFPHFDIDSDDEDVLNELSEYENARTLRRERIINSLDGDDLAFECMIGFRKFTAYLDPFLPMNIISPVDYFTKWIEAKPVATITHNHLKKFVWDNIVYRFGLLGEIVSDNEKQFRDNLFKDWCEKLCIRQCFASVKHPQTNGLVERANRNLGEGIKARLDERSKDWIEELLYVLWSHRTMIKSSNWETSFSLTYGMETVIPAEIGMPTLRTMKVDPTKSDESLEVNLDLIEEKREQAAIQEAKSKTKMEKYYNSRVRDTSFRPGDMVYRSNDASHARD